MTDRETDAKISEAADARGVDVFGFVARFAPTIFCSWWMLRVMLMTTVFHQYDSVQR